MRQRSQAWLNDLTGHFANRRRDSHGKPASQRSGNAAGAGTLTATTELVPVDTVGDLQQFTAHGSVNVSAPVIITITGDPGIPINDTAQYTITVSQTRRSTCL